MKEFKKNSEFIKVAFFVNIIMFIIHVAFLIIFSYLNVAIMAYVNIASVLIYLFCFFLVRKNFSKLYLLLLMTELWTHLVFATICCGWDCGFQLYCFAMISVIFYTKYLYSDDKRIDNLPIVVCIISIFLYMMLRFHTYNCAPLYSLNKTTTLIFYCSNSVFVFCFISVFLIFYTNNVIKSEHNLHEIADYDELTELYNRHRMRDILSRAYDNTQGDKYNFCTTIIDIDDFKIVNDTYGHEAGDYILKTVSTIMQKICAAAPRQAFIGRWGGEEFLVVQEYEREKNKGVVPCIETIKEIHDSIRDYYLRPPAIDRLRL